MTAVSMRRRSLLVALVLGLVFAPAAFAGGGPAVLSFTPPSWSPSIASGSTTSQTFTLTNSGGRSAGTVYLSITGSGSDAFSIVPGSDTCSGNGLGPRGRSCTVSVQYAPTSNGETDTATLRAAGEHASATLSLNGESPSPPIANNDSYTVVADHTLTVSAADGVLANDTDPAGLPLRAQLVSGPSHGTLILNADGSFRYITSGYSGQDSFTYTAFDGTLTSSNATVTIDVTDSGGPQGAALCTSADDTGATCTGNFLEDSNTSFTSGAAVAVKSVSFDSALNPGLNAVVPSPPTGQVVIEVYSGDVNTADLLLTLDVNLTTGDYTTTNGQASDTPAGTDVSFEVTVTDGITTANGLLVAQIFADGSPSDDVAG